MNQKLIEQLKRHEGFRAKVYKCSAGKNTIGYGYNLDANPLKLNKFEVKTYFEYGISENVAEYHLLFCVAEITADLEKSLLWFEHLDDVRQCVLINMAYQMGVVGVLKFKKMLLAIKDKNYALASHEMLDSNWAIQTPNRAKEMAAQMECGEFNGN
jgi:lysozyme